MPSPSDQYTPDAWQPPTYQDRPIAPWAQLNPTDFTKANNAAFARAKDLTGQTTKSGLAGMRASLAMRGLLGSGQEVGATQNIAQSGMQNLSDVSREQAIQESQRQSEAARTAYEGAISQRGQDIGMRGQDIGLYESDANRSFQNWLEQFQGGLARRGQDITQRGQDINAQSSQYQYQNQQYQQLMQLLQMIMSGLGGGGLY